jgi:hypothetical protein
MDALIQKVVYIALLVVLIAAIWKAVKAYLEGKGGIKSVIKDFIIICIFLGAAPGLVEIASNLGESLVQPVQALTDYVSSSISSEFTGSMR